MGQMHLLTIVGKFIKKGRTDMSTKLKTSTMGVIFVSVTKYE